MLRILVETGFLLALNPRDRNHEWALEVLGEARRPDTLLFISPAAPIELSLIMRSRGLSDEEVSRALYAMEAAIKRYTAPYYPPLELRHLAYAAELRLKYPELGFFDSIHAAISILENLTYRDLDETVSKIVASEHKA